MPNQKFSESVLTKSKKGKIELRTLDSRGQYVLIKYLNPDTLELADKKKKIILRSEDGRVEAFFIIPLADKRKFLLIKDEEEKNKKIKLWNEKTKREEEVF